MKRKTSPAESMLARQFGKRLAELRTKRNLSREQLAMRVDVSLDSIKRFETGRRGPSIASLQKIADALECTIHDLFDFDWPVG